MSEPQAYLNGRFVPASQAVVSVTDGGFVQGTTVAEQLRTFGGKLFRLDEHLARLFHSLEIVQVEPGLSRPQFAEMAEQLVRRNHPLLATGDDLGLAIVVTPGPYRAMEPDASAGPTVCLHTFPLRFAVWAPKYDHGQALATTDVVQVPRECWPSELKCRSRMHYYLADRQAAARFPGSRAVMLDEDGFVVEATTANIVAYDHHVGLITPPRAKILPGISLAALAELATAAGITMVERDLHPIDLTNADEVFLTSTSPCIQPVTSLDGNPIGAGRPGPMFSKLIAAWSNHVGLDVVAQARQFSNR
jgi:branched-subunit amino acid aminotransferase/4-amino-4-deoxychorismate lyase